MKIWAIADLHLCFGTPEKNMAHFGGKWVGYAEKINANWRRKIGPEDLVLIPGDISWALKLDQALIDLKWLHNLPGIKVIIKGNHDYWWPTYSKLQAALPSSIIALRNNSFTYKDISIAGGRLWDTSEYNFSKYIEYIENKRANPKEKRCDPWIFPREIERLKLSLQKLDQNAGTKICLTHYPPIGADLQTSTASRLMEEYKINFALFGHLHNIKDGALPFGSKNGVRYICCSADYINFEPVSIG